MVISERKRTKTEAEFMKIPTENSPTFKNDANINIQKAQNPGHIYNQSLPGHLMTELLKVTKRKDQN